MTRSPSVLTQSLPLAHSRTAVLAAALEWLGRGVSLLPLGPDKCPQTYALKGTGHTRLNQSGQLKATWKPLQTKPPSETDLYGWFDRYPSMLGLVTGAISGRIVLDFDLGAGVELVTRLGLLHLMHVQTPSGGYHWHIKHPGWPVRTVKSSGNLRFEQAGAQGLDVRGDGGYIAMPPQVFVTTKYQALRDLSVPDESNLVPEWIQRLVGLIQGEADRADRHHWVPGRVTVPTGHQGERSVSDSSSRGAGHPWRREAGSPYRRQELLNMALDKVRLSGHRNDHGYWLAQQLLHEGLSLSEARQLMEGYVSGVPGFNAKGEPEAYTRAEAHATLESVYRYSTPLLPMLIRPAAQPASAWPVLDCLTECWPGLSDRDRHESAVALLGSRQPELRVQGAATLRRLNYALVSAEADLQDRLRLHQAVPGLNRLTRLLNAARR